MVEKTLGDVATYINGRAFKPQEWETSGRPIIRIQNLTNSTQECNRTTKQFEEKYRISDGDFYTAITRAKEKLKIYWSSETMQEVVAGFSVDTSRQKSLAIIKEKLKQDKNT